MLKSCLKTLTKKKMPTSIWNTTNKRKQITLITKRFYLLPLLIICSYRVRHLGLSTAVSLSKTRYLIGRIVTNKTQKNLGLAQTIRIYRFRVWLCLLIAYPNLYVKLPCKANMTNLTLTYSSLQRVKAMMLNSPMKTKFKSGLTLFVAHTYHRVLTT